MQIIPAILTDEQIELIKQIERIKQSKKFNRVQIDFVDGKFAINKSVKVEECKSIINFSEIKFDAHLIVVEENVQRYTVAARTMGFDRIIAQMEAISHPENFTALALDVHSPVAAIKPYLAKLDYVVVMAVEPGLGGQEFVNEAVEHVKELRKYNLRICVDGGVEKEHLPQLEKLGVDEVAVGARRVLQW